tara:strand:- start:103 stop:852 length:750 start_codon:yes stop_codon:yes gene_type:complete
MIHALLIRRFWLWKNRFLSSLFMMMLMPITVFSVIYSPLQHIFPISLLNIPFEKWVYPSLIFLIASINLFPLIYRDFFDLRLHRKVIGNLSLAPFTKQKIINSYLIILVLETVLITLSSILIISNLIVIPLGFYQHLIVIIHLIIYLLTLSNLLITLSLKFNSPTIYMLLVFCVYIIIFFGSGLIIEFGFFPITLANILSWSPLSIPIVSMQKALLPGFLQLNLIIYSILIILIWSFVNGLVLQKVLKQ